MDRTQFIENQARLLDEPFMLAPGEEPVRRHFERLAVDTYDALSAADIRSIGPFKLSFNFLDNCVPRLHALVPNSLLERWKDWKGQYKELLERNPRLEICDMMHEIGYADQCTSWPYYMEEAIQDWLDGGEITASPFVNDLGIVTPEFYSRLRELRKKVGGWLYWDVERGVVFLAEDDWQRLRIESRRTGVLAGRGKG
jgi:hypothetical protein